MNQPQMTLTDAESILGQILEHPNLTLSYANHLIAREALRKLVEAGQASAMEQQPQPATS